MEEPQAAIAPLGVLFSVALNQVSEIQVPAVKVPLLQATEITKGYLPLFVPALMLVEE